MGEIKPDKDAPVLVGPRAGLEAGRAPRGKCEQEKDMIKLY